MRWLGRVTVLPRAALVTAVGYLGVLTVAAWSARPGRVRRPRSPSDLRVAVLIPAHDEEGGIGATLASVAAGDYPASLVAVHVVADHCTDGTADVVRSSGDVVHERNDGAPGKGPALTWLLDRLAATGERFDVYVFVDADTVLAPDALTELIAVVAAGHPVVQGHYAVLDPEQTGVVAFRAAALAARTFLRPLGRTAIGGSAGLYGTGMAFRADVAAGLRWSGHLTEDIETHLELLERGILVAFAPDARFEAEMPATLEASASQHERWERGRAELARAAVPRLCRRAVRGGPAGRRAYLDAALDQSVPPFSIVVLASGAWVAIASLRLAVAPRSRAARRDVALAALTMTTQAAYVWSAVRLDGSSDAVVRSLWKEGPKMLWWKVRLWARVMTTRGDGEWVRTARNTPGTS